MNVPKTTKALGLLLAMLMTTPVMSEQLPVGRQADARIKTYAYEENNVYRLDLYLKAVTAIQFDIDEEISSILVGDSASWEVVKLSMGNVISIKPIIDGALTNMTVYTNKRVYTFELRSVGEIQPGAKAGANQSFRTIFLYPETLRPKARKIARGQPNHDYLISGDAAFVPEQVSDDKLQTTFVLPVGAPRPVIYKVGPKGTEEIVNSRTDGNRVIVDGTSNFWVMRIGDERVCVGKARAVASRNIGFGGLFRGR